MDAILVVLGAGEMASGTIRALHRAGLRRVLACELERPRAIRRSVSFAQAVFDGSCVVEDIPGVRISELGDAEQAWAQGAVPVLVAHNGALERALAGADVLVDARMARRNLGVSLRDASLVVGLGPGFCAGIDVHAVVETARGHDLGRVIWAGPAQPATGVPGELGGETVRRIVRAPRAGVWRAVAVIGDFVEQDEVVGLVDGAEARAGVKGVLRGVMHDEVDVHRGLKVADVDPRGRREACFTTSDKARLVGAGVLEAVLETYVGWGIRQEELL